MDRIIHLLDYGISVTRSGVAERAPIRYNFARDFPLHKPELTRYFHVYRTSVRQLLQTFERRNGVRLWCSVRRSGKTTACFDLSTTTGASSVVTQTCDLTVQTPGAGLFYSRVREALDAARDISDSFFSEIVSQCAASGNQNIQRVVFVLDEYETLFGRLKLAARRSRELRYTVVQPLLNQMVMFARENLIIFIGQQPDAHYILMDQNQLSPYVQQDLFPLFQHQNSDLSGEFSQLVRKVLTVRIGYEPQFVDAIYAETGGHPFLTVNLLVTFFDWLIEKEYDSRRLRLTPDDFSHFADDCLSPDFLSMCPEYGFFRNAIIEALGADGRSEAPWLHIVYRCLRQIAQRSRGELICTRGVFSEICERLGVRTALGMSPDHLLGAASSANFFGYDHSHVWPKIRLLARLCAATEPPIRF